MDQPEPFSILSSQLKNMTIEQRVTPELTEENIENLDLLLVPKKKPWKTKEEVEQIIYDKEKNLAAKITKEEKEKFKTIDMSKRLRDLRFKIKRIGKQEDNIDFKIDKIKSKFNNEIIKKNAKKEMNYYNFIENLKLRSKLLSVDVMAGKSEDKIPENKKTNQFKMIERNDTYLPSTSQYDLDASQLSSSSNLFKDKDIIENKESLDYAFNKLIESEKIIKKNKVLKMLVEENKVNKVFEKINIIKAKKGQEKIHEINNNSLDYAYSSQYLNRLVRTKVFDNESQMTSLKSTFKQVSPTKQKKEKNPVIAMPRNSSRLSKLGNFRKSGFIYNLLNIIKKVDRDEKTKKLIKVNSISELAEHNLSYINIENKPNPQLEFLSYAKLSSNAEKQLSSSPIFKKVLSKVEIEKKEMSKPKKLFAKVIDKFRNSPKKKVSFYVRPISIPKLDFSFLCDQPEQPKELPPILLNERSRSIPKTYNQRIRKLNYKFIETTKRSSSPFIKSFKDRLLDQINEQTRLELLRKELEIKKHSNY